MIITTFLNSIQNSISFFFSIPFIHEFLIFYISLCYLIILLFTATDKTIALNLSLILNYFTNLKKLFIFLILFSIILLFSQFFLIINDTFFNNFIINNYGIIFFKLITIFFGLISFKHFSNFIYKFYDFWDNLRIYPLILTGSFFFLLLILSTFNLFLTIFSILGMSICLYVILLSFYNFGKLVREAGIKYFLFSALSTGFLFGAAKEFYVCCGSLDFDKLNEFIISFIYLNVNNLENLFIIKYAILFLFFGFLFKLSAFPTQFWAPEVYEGASFSIITFIAIPTKFVISLIFLKIIKFCFIIPINNFYLNLFLLHESNLLLQIVIIGSILYGGINAFFEMKVKRFIAYSSINQIGFLLIALLHYNNSLFSIVIFLYFLFTYLINLLFFLTLINWYIFKLNIFINTNIIKEINCNNFNLTYLSDFKFFFWYFKNSYYLFPILKYISIAFWLSFIITLFSMAGIPPLLGFYGKFYILFYAFKYNYFIIFSLGILMSILGAYYYLRIIKICFFEQVLINNEINQLFIKINWKELSFKLNFGYLLWFFFEIKNIFNYTNFINFMNIICWIYCLVIVNTFILDNYFIRFLYFIAQTIIGY